MTSKRPRRFSAPRLQTLCKLLSLGLLALPIAAHTGFAQSSGGHDGHHTQVPTSAVPSAPPTSAPRASNAPTPRSAPRGQVALKLSGSATVNAGAPSRISFQLLTSAGTGPALKAADLETVHEKKLHVLIYDASLSQFFHVHPEEKDGIWTTEVVPFSVDGQYWMWAEGKINGAAHEFTLPVRLTVKGGQKALPIPKALPEALSGEAGTSRVTLTGTPLVAGQDVMPEIEISRTDGSTPNVKPYLGALAHVVLVPLAGNKLLHVHPMPGNGPNKLMLHTKFPKAGDYRAWVQFHDGDELKTVPLSLKVK